MTKPYDNIKKVIKHRVIMNYRQRSRKERKEQKKKTKMERIISMKQPLPTIRGRRIRR